MNTKEIERFALSNEHVRKIFCGVHAVNRLPKRKITKPCFFVINNCNENIVSDFCHWIGVAVSDKKVFFFDTSGTLSYKQNPYFLRFIKLQQRPVESLNYPIQSLLSDFCGIFVLVFGYSFSIGLSFSSFIKLFDKKNLVLNDEIVYRLFKFMYLDRKE